jgi:hypothetical protein
MASKEKLYERPLKRNLDEDLKAEILSMFQSKRDLIPGSVDMCWHPKEPVLSLRGPMGVAFHVHFEESREILEVFAELGFAARMIVTEAHREQAKQIIHDIADELEL